MRKQKQKKNPPSDIFTRIELHLSKSLVRNYASVVRLLVSGVSSIDLIRTQETRNKKIEIVSCNAVVG